MLKIKNIFKIGGNLLVFLSILFLLITISPYLPFKDIPKFYIVVSGSMEPSIKSGSLVLTKSVNPKELKIGDVIAFTSPYNSKDTILHRIESIKSTDPLRFSTKGDHNHDPDSWDITELGVKGLYQFSIPHLGKVIAFIRQPLGFILAICLPAILLILSEIFKIKQYIDDEVNRRVQKKLKDNFPKTTSLIIFLTFISSIFTVDRAKSIYTATTTISDISFHIEEQFIDLESSITTFPESSLINLRNFDIGASANSAAASIKLYYSFNFNPHWEEYPEIITGNDGTFNFSAPKGDGLYDFATLATDIFGNIEVKDFDFFANQIKVDTIPPTTNLNPKSLSSPSYSGQNYLSSGDFEKGMADWKIDSSVGDHHIFEEDENQNHLFILGSDTRSINGTDALYQNFFLPSSASATLNFSYRLFSQDTSEYDHFNVDLFDASGNQLIETVLSVGNLSTDFTSDTGWRSVSRSLSHLVNQNLRLRFSLTDTGPGDDYNSWLFLDDVKVSTLDTRVGETSTVDFLASDLSSLIAETTPPTNLTIGENDLIFTATDSAYNSDNNHHQNITVLPPLVLNKLFFHTAGFNSVEIYNNSSESLLLSNYQLTESKNNNIKNFGHSDPTYLAPHTGYNFYFDLYGRGSDTVYLKIGDSIIDSVTYQPKSESAYYDGEYWFRSPSGLGPWTSSVSPLSALLTRLSSNKLTLSVSYIPQNFGSNQTDFLEYEILYSDSAGPQQIIGRISPQSVDQNLSQRDFYLGTCSSGSCLPSSGLGNSFTLKINGSINNQLISPSTRTFNLPL